MRFFCAICCSATRVLPQFDPKSKRVESNTFDELGKTKTSAKESSRAGWMGGLWGGSAVDNDSSDDDDAKPESKRRVTIGGYASDGSSDCEGPANSAFGRAGRWGSFARSMSADLRKASSQLPEGVEIVGGDGTFEEQEDGDAAFVVPEGAHVKVTLPGMSPWQLEEDGRLHKYSLLVAVKLDRLPYAGAARARRLTLLHRYICSAHRIRPSFPAMPSSSSYVCTRSDRPDPRSRLCHLSRPLLRRPAAMPLFNGGAPPAQGESVDSCYLYKNGGVGMLGQMGDASAAVRPERWAWVVVTRSSTNDVHTYVNGRLCTKVSVTVIQPKDAGKSDQSDSRQSQNGASGGGSGAGGIGGDQGGDADDGNGLRSGEGGKGKRAGKSDKLPERLCIDPMNLALFASNTADATGGDASDDGERGLSLRYVKLTTECWDAAEVRKQLDALRAKDEETVLDEEADAVCMLAAVTSDPLAALFVSAMPAVSRDDPMKPLPALSPL